MPDMKRLLSFLNVPASPPAPPTTPREYFASLPRIETPRLLLRPMSMRDARDIHAYSRDAEVARHVLWSAHRSIGETKDFIRWMLAQYHSGEPSSWCIVEKATGTVIGTIGFMTWQPENATVEAGYSLARSHWNRGIMTEALDAMLHECFVTLNLNRVEAQHFSANPASGRVMEKCGMTHEGTLRHRICNKGQYMDVEMWGILQSDWLRQHPQP